MNIQARSSSYALTSRQSWKLACCYLLSLTIPIVYGTKMAFTVLSDIGFPNILVGTKAISSYVFSALD